MGDFFDFDSIPPPPPLEDDEPAPPMYAPPPVIPRIQRNQSKEKNLPTLPLRNKKDSKVVREIERNAEMQRNSVKQQQKPTHGSVLLPEQVNNPFLHPRKFSIDMDNAGPIVHLEFDEMIEETASMNTELPSSTLPKSKRAVVGASAAAKKAGVGNEKQQLQGYLPELLAKLRTKSEATLEAFGNEPYEEDFEEDEEFGAVSEMANTNDTFERAMKVMKAQNKEEKIKKESFGAANFNAGAPMTGEPSFLVRPKGKAKLMGAHVSKFDSNLLKWVNAARTDPKCLIPYLEERIEKFEPNSNNFIVDENTRLVTREGKTAVQEAIDFLGEISPRNELQWSDDLARVCEVHVEEIGGAGLYSHNLSDGSQPTDRIIKELPGKVASAAESLKFNSHDAKQTILDLIIDDGVESRGNRLNLFGRWDLYGCFTGMHKISKSMTTFLFVQSNSFTEDLIKKLVAKVCANVKDPEGWLEKRQNILYTNGTITVTNTYIMPDGREKIVEVKKEIDQSEHQ